MITLWKLNVPNSRRSINVNKNTTTILTTLLPANTNCPVELLISEMHDETTLCLKKNDNDVLRYNFSAHQPISIIFGRDIAESVCY